MTRILEGVRILEVAEHTFVPAASAVLSDLGAEVIKIEHVTRGDGMRGLAASGIAVVPGNVHVLLEHSNRGKRSLGLDLTSPDGVAILYKLAATCDVFLTNKLPSVRKRLEIDVEHIRAANPNIIYVRGTGPGRARPRGRQGLVRFPRVLGSCRSRRWRPAPGRRTRAGAAGSGLRRLHRGDDHRRRNHGSALPPRANRRSHHRRRITSGDRTLGHGPGGCPVARAERRGATIVRQHD